MLVPMLWHRRGDAAKTIEGLHVKDFEESKLSQVLGLIRSCAALSEAACRTASLRSVPPTWRPGSHPEARHHGAHEAPSRGRRLAHVHSSGSTWTGRRAYMEVLYVDPRYPGPGPIRTLVETAKEKLAATSSPLEKRVHLPR